MKKVTVLGGGTGHSIVLKALKMIEDVEINAIVSVADDGGSTGRLRNVYNIPAMGDIRNVMVALADSESLFKELMEYRFSGKDDVGGHNLGNLILTAMSDIAGGFDSGIQQISKVLKVEGKIIPVTNQSITLCARMADDTIIKGECQIRDIDKKINYLFYENYVQANEYALSAIRNADYIILGLGSLYTSILPNLIVPQIKEELAKTKAKIIYVCNAMSEHGETDGFKVHDYIQAINLHLGVKLIDTVIVNIEKIPEYILEKYEEEQAYPVLLDKSQISKYIKVVERNLLTFTNNNVRHDIEKLSMAFKEEMDDQNVICK